MDLLLPTRHVFEFIELVPGCKYDIGEAFGTIVVPMNQTDMRKYLNDMDRITNDILHQIKEKIGSSIDVHILSQCIFFDHRNDEEQDRTDRSKNKKLMSKNNIAEISHELCDDVEQKIQVHQKKSGVTFEHGVFFELTYRVDKSKDKREKKKAGSYVNHLNIPCFTKPVRDTDMKNFQGDKQQQRVFNIIDNDDLCFL